MHHRSLEVHLEVIAVFVEIVIDDASLVKTHSDAVVGVSMVVVLVEPRTGRSLKKAGFHAAARSVGQRKTEALVFEVTAHQLYPVDHFEHSTGAPRGVSQRDAPGEFQITEEGEPVVAQRADGEIGQP